jgi:hypothetical protein
MFLGETRHLTAADTHDQCAITQQAQNNGGGETIAASGHSPEQCAALTVATTCSYPSHDGTCVSTATCASCTESPLPPTHGSAISMPSYGTEPANYFPPSP